MLIFKNKQTNKRKNDVTVLDKIFQVDLKNATMNLALTGFLCI